jgi:hypothetical protein
MAAAKSMGTAQSDNLLVIEAHAAKDGSQVVLFF